MSAGQGVGLHAALSAAFGGLGSSNTKMMGQGVG